MTETLPAALLGQIYRNKKLVKQYEEVGPAGTFGKLMLERDIKASETALCEGDTVAMIGWLKKLRENK
jgi:hypothetical protein